MDLDIRKENKKDFSILYVGGEIDAYTAPQLKEELLPMTENEGDKILVDLKGVDYIDSTGLGIFIGALKSAKSHNSTIELTGLNSRVKRLFSITGLDEVINIDNEKREEAK
ncbi:STAS domain-containing protein [Alteribacillus iranensis]|uniref:Anti-sigma factor antagonist n=1 Tax=Alteribacillus iranensis TaxID=930128 RepID=A0A1I2DEB7_9BACI|nr:STAS domain-containing protein [Alteribacillus iranensis]SFE78857.1 anti-sigma B factor antagonist [Alteribacillus iranensis]